MAHIEDELKELLNLTRINYKDVIDSSPYTLREFQQKNRHMEIVIWRQFVVMFARLEGMTMTKAGKTANQDHCMVINATKMIYSRLNDSQYPEYLEILNIIKDHINGTISSDENIHINEMNCLILLDHLIAKKYANIN